MVCKLALCLVCVMVIKRINNMNILCYSVNMKGQQRELGSSLPIVGGGDIMTKYEKIALIISVLSLVVDIIALYK